jgi:6-phosphofructokinase 1
MRNIKKIAILTGGGDCPGINAVIRAVAKKAINEYGLKVIGLEDGYEGLIHNHYRTLEYGDVSGIITLGGTILGTSNTANPYRYARREGDKLEFDDLSQIALDNYRKMGADCLVCIGGDGTLSIAHRLCEDGIPIIGIPKTIDNDLRGTDITFGFDSAVSIATEGIDRIHSTAQSHHRVMIVEVMGRNAGWIALHAGVASGGDIILIPEISYDIDIIVEKVNERLNTGKRFSIIVVSEGAKTHDGNTVVKRVVKYSTDPVRFGGISFVLASKIEEMAGIESRAVVMGHLQRGGTPTPFDRILATTLGTRAVDMIKEEKYGYMVGVQSGTLVDVPLLEVAKGQRTVPVDTSLLESARSVGVSFGDRL